MSLTVVKHEGIAFVAVDNPPVNALNLELRQAMLRAVSDIDKDSEVLGVVLHCTGRTFIAGADIAEFARPPVAPHLPEVVKAIEQSNKPWIAAIHGRALGGGLEVSLACHYRVAMENSLLGLPEVTLGIIPGSGGTVRLPRLIGLEPAITMVTTGVPISASEALDQGLIDDVVPVRADSTDDETIKHAATLFFNKTVKHGEHQICSTECIAIQSEPPRIVVAINANSC